MLRVFSAANKLDFLATDIALTSTSIATVSTGRNNLFVFHVPHILTAVTVVYNLPGFSSGTLNMTATVFAKILRRVITQWNDAELLAINPALSSSGADLTQAIIPIGRSDPASTTHEITTFLSTAAADGTWTTGISTSVSWVAGVQTAPDGGPLAVKVNATPYSFGYAKKKTAEKNGCKMAALLNKQGNYVYPSNVALVLAVNSAISGRFVPLPADATNAWSELNMGRVSTDPLGYPATFFSYIVAVQSNQLSVGSSRSAGTNATALAAFFNYVNTATGQTGLPTGFVSLTSALMTTNLDTVAAWLTPGGKGAGTVAAAPANANVSIVSCVLAVLIAAVFAKFTQ